MLLKNTNVARCLSFLVIITGLAGAARLYSQYLLDDEEIKKEQEKKHEPVEEKKDAIPRTIAYNIKAARISGVSDITCAIKVSFDLNPEYAGEYVVARSSQMIDTREKVHASRVIQTINATSSNTVIDKDCTPGIYYYVAVSKKSILDNTIELYRDMNYTSIPVQIHSGEALYRVTDIKAVEIEDYKVGLTWKPVDKTGILYTAYRSRSVINSPNRLRSAEQLKVVPDAGEYVDDGITASGVYYYAVTAKVLDGREDTLLIPDENYTSVGVTINIAGKIRIGSINARAEKDGVAVTWSYSGAQGDTNYRLFRSEKQLTNASEVSSRDIISVVDLAKKKYKDMNPFPASYYYGLIPNAIGEKEVYRLIPGVNITRKPVLYRGEEEKIGVEPGDIDRILKRTFFKNKYREAVKELQNLIGRSDNEEEVAKARLFIGRSHIELGQYRKALDFLILTDVRKFFPKQADFWEEFALTRIRNR